jgi:hypothetical protein
LSSMGRRTTIIESQNLLDIALQETGDITAVFAIAMANGLGVTDTVAPGTELEIPGETDGNRDIYNYYRSNGLRPATGSVETAEILDGIGYWYIELDFISS